MSRVLFVVKRREDYSAKQHGDFKSLSTGLYNSVVFMNDMLKENCIESKMVVVVDNNQIDKEVYNFNPDYVIIEALWVVPSKFEVLTRLHPKVKWIVRLHSELPFIANEGIAMDWIADYMLYPNVYLGVNGNRMIGEMTQYLSVIFGPEIKKKIWYLPNYYPLTTKHKEFKLYNNTINISCFGAVRPLKNHLAQAIGALKFAEDQNLSLRFHINGTRLEQNGSSVSRNLQGMFQQLAGSGHELIMHEWHDKDSFDDLCATMDIGMQVSFSETFNIVEADLLNQGVPLVVSKEIPWNVPWFTANPTDTDDIANKLFWAMSFPNINTCLFRRKLYKYIGKTIDIWVSRFKDEA